MSAVELLSTRRRGALIVFPRRVGVKNIIQTGTTLNAEISTNLISTIFFEGTSLHDGAMIVEGDRIVAAGCFLPLSEREDVESTFGARHRAALGMAEETDALVVVVSEENGAVSLAHDGNIRYNITLAEVEAGLKSLLRVGAARRGCPMNARRVHADPPGGSAREGDLPRRGRDPAALPQGHHAHRAVLQRAPGREHAVGARRGVVVSQDGAHHPPRRRETRSFRSWRRTWRPA